MDVAREILLIRHPQTVANLEGRHLGRGDAPYTPLGDLQAARISQVLRDWVPDSLLCSPSRRAFVPALGSGVALTVDAGLSEFDVGDSEGSTHEEGIARGTILDGDWLDEEAYPHVGGERTGDFQRRVQDAWSRVVSSNGERIAVVSHRGVIAAMTVYALNMDPKHIFDIRIDPAEGVLLEISRGHTVLCRLGVLPGSEEDGTMHSSPLGAAARARDEDGPGVDDPS